MDEISQRTWHVRLLLMLVLSVAAVATCLLSLMWAKASSAQEEPTDNKSNFVVHCKFSHRNSDDPIVHPGEPGAAHSHDFFGNTSTDAFSTYESLRAAGTTCSRPTDTAAYWIPTVMWEGENLQASRGLFYYLKGGKDPAQVSSLPAGLKMLSNKRVSWRCVGETPFQENPPTQCSNGKLGVLIKFPDCSNGELDSADHMSHMAYAVKQSGGPPRQCPPTHPTPVPSLNLIIHFPIPTSEGQVTLSSGDASTMHADFFNGWDQERLDTLVATCINGFDPSKPRPKECKPQGG